MSKPKFEAEWEDFKGHVALTWDKLNDSDLLRVQGDFTELVKLISEKYGETKTAVEGKLNELYTSYLDKKNNIAKGINAVKETVQHKSEEFVSNVKEKATQFQDAAKERMKKLREESIDPAVQKSEEYIKMHPFTAVLGALGVGLLLGTIVGMMASRKD